MLGFGSMMKLFFISILLSHSFQSFPQYEKQKLSLYGYNIGFAGITTGIGRVINKNKNEKFATAFWQGFKHGMLGGTILFSAKQLSYQITNEQNLVWGWPVKLLHSYGASIMENSSNHAPIFKSLRFPVGFIWFDLDFTGSLKGKIRFAPASLASFIVMTVRDNFNLTKTLSMGIPYFEYNDTLTRTGGYSLINSMSINNSYAYSQRVDPAHELIHNLQVREYFIFYTYFTNSRFVKKFQSPDKKLEKFLSDFLYPDIPYITPLYNLNKALSKNYYGNLYELEAQHFATNQFVH